MLKINLGSGDKPLADYKNVDAKYVKNGTDNSKIYPLPNVDNSVDEIRASHVLEHFPHAQIRDVLRDWVRALKPGGTLKIAVPDFALIAQQYLAGAGLPTQGYIMGGQVDDLDYHRAIFDDGQLRALLREVGLVAIKQWKSETDDCAALPISLNLCGTKPPAEWPKVSAVISMPRLGFNDFWACAYQELSALHIPLSKVTGAYWDRDLSLGIERAMDDATEAKPEWILTCDYDTVFTRHQVLDLLSIASRYPHADAIAPLQTARHHAAPMFTARLPDGQIMRDVPRETLAGGEILLAETAHFGLTLLRVSKLRALPKPWFARVFDEQGGFSDRGRDPDVNFWHQWKAAGNTLYVALRVPVGHCELMVRWPDANLETAFQRPSEFWAGGPPDNLWR